MPRGRKKGKATKYFTADGKSKKRVRAARTNLRAMGRRFRSIEAKMKFLRSLKRG